MQLPLRFFHLTLKLDSMIKPLLTGLIVLLAYSVAWAQLPDECPGGATVPAETCETACINCNFNGYTGSTGGFAGDPEPLGWCSDIQNDQWLGFIAGGTSATFTVTPSGCSAGVQAAVYPAGCNDVPINCNAGCSSCGGTPTTFAVTGMIPGSNYYLIIDGYGGDVCNFTISVTPASAVQAPNVGATPNVTGPATACPGETYTYSITPVSGAGFYTWESSNPNVLFNGQPGPVDLEAPGGRTVTVTFPEGETGSFDICVTPVNSCSMGAQKCRTVTVANPPPVVYPRKYVCAETTPYILPWGDPVFTNGIYEHIEPFPGCDTVYRQQVTFLNPIFTNLVRYVCQGSCYSICGFDYCETGNFSATCTSFRGCDSTVNLDLRVLSPVADIIPTATAFSCGVTSITLNSATSPNTPGLSVKVWKNLATGATQNGNSLTITTAGTYILTTTMTAGGMQCSKSDTIIITGSGSAVTATGVNAIVGCGTGAVQISVNSTVPNPVYAWSGPNGFNSAIQSPLVTEPGTYTVTVTGTGAASACVATATAVVTGNTTPPVVTANAATITCAQPSALLVATSDVPATFNWSNTIQNDSISVMAPGTYTVTVTNTANNCTATATSVVGESTTTPGASASVSGPIGCPTPSVNLTGNSATSGVTYHWAGPGLTGDGQTAMASLAGTYTVTVTGTNGCVSTATVAVTGDVTLPTASVATTNLNCAVPSDTLFASSATPGVVYAWSGGTTGSTLIVNAAGPYTVTVTGTNGCTNTATATVNGDFATPNASATGAVLTCAATSVAINGASSTPAVTYSWTGPGGSVFNGQMVNVSTIGTYTLTVRGSNGCTATATADVTPDSNLPNISVQTDTITCLQTAAVITGNSTTSGVTYTWTGAGITPGNEHNPVQNVAQDGTYTLTINNPSNGCSSVATVVVLRDDDPPGVTTQGDTLTCTQSNLQLFANSNAHSVAYSWAGPAFTSTDQNPIIMTAGTYTVTATAPNGCVSTAQAIVQADQGIPVLDVITSQLTCAVTSVVLHTTSSVPVDYDWSGTNFTSTDQSPTVVAPGTYTLTATADNGCSSTVSVVVIQDISVPQASAQGDTLTCNSPSVILQGSTSTPGATIFWPELNTSMPNPTVITQGTYSLVVTGANGCKNTVTAQVVENKEAPIVQISPVATITCANPTRTVDINATVQHNTITGYQWSNGAALQDISVTTPGIYTCTVTLSNGCTASASTTVTEDKTTPDVTADGGIITCSETVINILANSATTGVLYAWSGGLPAVASPEVTATGTYTVTVTAANGCTNTATALVTDDVAPPVVSVASSNILDCAMIEATLTATANTAVTYQWTGLASGTSPELLITLPGTYTVIATAQNGCTSSQIFNQAQDVNSPGATALGGETDCISGSITLTGGSPTNGVSYEWTGPGTPAFASSLQNPTAATPGVYTLTVTGSNGCKSTSTAVVTANMDAPDAAIQGSGILTCAVQNIALSGSSNTANATLLWTFPNGATSPASDISAVEPGLYTLSVTGPNGCITVETLNLGQNIIEPGNVLATGGTINCDHPQISLAASCNVANAEYLWTGPDGTTYDVAAPMVEVSGDYELVITNPLNGCTSVTAVVVLQDTDLPQIDVTTTLLTCTNPVATLDATTNVTNAQYLWNGPGTFTSNLSDPTTQTAGSYVLKVTNPVNGCSDSFTIEVLANQELPNVTTQNSQVTCQQPSTALQANSATPNVSYNWTAPGGQTLPGQNPVVSQPGTYTVMVTDNVNGCVSTATATINPDQNIPVVTVTGGELTCTIDSIQLTGAANKPNVVWAWTGPGFESEEQNPTITVSGTYTLIATTPINGCTGEASVVVTEDRVAPVVSIATPAQITCTTTQVNLSASATSVATPIFSWTTQNGNIISGGNSNVPTVNQAGAYTVLVTNPDNGCTTERTANVTVDEEVPSAANLQVKDVSCYGYSNGAVAIADITGGSEPFSYSLDNQPFTVTPQFTALPPGVHAMRIMDANGCELELDFEILEPEELVVNLGPDTLLRLGDQITLSLNNTVNYPARVETTMLTPSSLDTLLCPTCNGTFTPIYSLQYKLTVVDSNGCRAEDTRFIIVDRTRHIFVPNYFSPGKNNGDINSQLTVFGGNDVERIKSFNIYDRWGNAVHEARNFKPGDQDAGWDGTVKGKPANPAVFVYTLEVLFKDGESELYSGDITVSR